MNRRSFLTSSAAAGATVVFDSPAFSASARLSHALDSYFTPFVKSLDYSGVIVVARRGEVIANKAYGFANYEFQIPHTVNTRYWAGSISKMFTRAAIIALERAAKLQQSEPLSRYLPDYPDGDEITIRQLVDHRAGIARDLFLGTEQTEPHTVEQIVAMVAKIPPIAKPGEKEFYSNNGYRILARVIEIAGHGVFSDVVRETVFQPLGMNDTLEPDLRDVVPRMASGYVAGDGFGTLRHAAYFNVVNEPGAGAFYSTPSDLLKFCRRLPIEAADLEPLQPKSDGGWVEPRLAGHDGLGNGFAAFCYRFPDEDLNLVMMCNIETGLFVRLNTDLPRMIFGQSVGRPELPRRAYALDRSRAQLYVGNYDLFPGAPLIVRLSDGGLEVSAGDAFQPIVPIGGDEYFMRLKFAHIHFDMSDGRPVSVTWKQENAVYTLKRLS